MMTIRALLALCVGLFAALGASAALSQTYIPTYQQFLAVENELSTCNPGPNVMVVGGRLTGIDATSCPLAASLASHYQLSDFYGQLSITVDVSGRVFFTHTFNGSTVYNEAFFNNISTQFNSLFDQCNCFTNVGNGAGSFGSFTYTGTEALDATVTIFGLKAVASVAAGSTTINVALPQLTRFGPSGFQLQGTGPTRLEAVSNLVTNAGALPQPQIQELEQSVLAYWEATQPTDPLAGNPASVQGIAVRNAMDLGRDDSVLDGESPNAKAGPGNGQAGSWLIGLAYGQSYTDGYSNDTDHVDANIEKNWRIFQGQRTRLQLSVPVSYSNALGGEQFQGGAALGLEQPLLDGRWSLEPEISWGVALSNRLQSMGHLIVGSLTSRYRIDGIGRGYFIIGNMVGYSTTLSTSMIGVDLNPHVQNWVFRNGIAYEYPLNIMVFGRGSSVRASYVFTDYTGSPLAVEQFHEASLTFGVRSREGQLHNTYEAFRLGISAIVGRKYNLFSGSVGFRF